MKKFAFATGIFFVLLILIIFFLRPASNSIPDRNSKNYILINSNKINYIDAGSGIALVFIHGFGASNYSWRNNLDPISKYYRVCAPDLPGFGYSDKPLDADYSVDSYAEFIIRFMDKLQIREAVLVGHSLGGGIAMLTSLKYPSRVKGLILIDAEAYPISPPLMLKVSKLPLLRSYVHKLIGKWVIRISLKRSFYDQSLVTDVLVDNYYAPFLTKNGKSAPIKVLQAMDFEKLEKVTRHYLSIKKKTLILWGKEDRISKIHLAFRMKKDLKKSTLRIIPKSGHLVQEERPAVVNRAIISFVRREWKHFP